MVSRLHRINLHENAVCAENNAIDVAHHVNLPGTARAPAGEGGAWIEKQADKFAGKIAPIAVKPVSLEG